MTPFTRRALFSYGALLVLGARLRLFAQGAAPSSSRAAAISLEEFLRLSERLTGRTNLDLPVAAMYREALLAMPANLPLLADLAAGSPRRTTAHAALEVTILQWWYTGAYWVGRQLRQATHDGALMWSALDMPAPGTCAGVFGAWADPPRP
jgi:hypothetical protein